LRGSRQLPEVPARVPGAKQRHPVGVAASDAAYPCVAGGFVVVRDLGEKVQCPRLRHGQHADRAFGEPRQTIGHLFGVERAATTSVCCASACSSVGNCMPESIISRRNCLLSIPNSLSASSPSICETFAARKVRWPASPFCRARSARTTISSASSDSLSLVAVG